MPGRWHPWRSPGEHRARIHGTSPLERVNGEIKRRTDVVDLFPEEAAVTRLVGAILLEQNDEGARQRRTMGRATLAPISASRMVHGALPAPVRRGGSPVQRRTVPSSMSNRSSTRPSVWSTISSNEAGRA